MIDKEKRRKTWIEVKPVENYNKIPDSFLEKSPMEKEVPPSHKSQDHAKSSRLLLD